MSGGASEFNEFTPP
jgi:hypothetical protein